MRPDPIIRVPHRSARRALPAAVALAAMLLAGCGGGGSGEPVESTSAATGPVDGVAAAVVVPATYPTGRDTDEESESGAEPIRACRLVSTRQAEAILGAGVRRTEALQGPTCVYTGSGRQVTVVVERAKLRTLRTDARRADPVSIAGRRGWCLTYETTAVVVALGHGRVLRVGGPCPAGVRFAAAALARLHR